MSQCEISCDAVTFFYVTFWIFFSPILLQINPSDYIPSFIKIGWGVEEIWVEQSQTEIDKLLLLIGYSVCKENYFKILSTNYTSQKHWSTAEDIF